MYFSRIAFDATSLDAGQVTRLLNQDNYQDHQLVWRLFRGRSDGERDFLFRRDQVNEWPCFYVVSATAPNADDTWQVESKIYEPRAYSGQRLTFSVRMNPVVSRWEGEGELRRQVRHDVVMDAKKSMGYGKMPLSERPEENQLIQDVGIDWLHSRCANWGFSIRDGVRVDGYRQHRMYKNGRPQPIRFSTLEYSGLLRVDEPDRLRRTLFEGIGKARGLGCGLLLVKPVRN